MSGGTFQADTYTNSAGTGAPTFTYGATGGSFVGSATTITSANGTATANDGFTLYQFSTGSANRTMTLVLVAGRFFTLTKTDTGTGSVTVSVPSGSLFGPSPNSSTLYAQNATSVIYCDGTNFYVVQSAVNVGSTASTFTFNGTGGTSGSITLRYRRVDDWVTFFSPPTVATSGTSSTQLGSNTAIPAWASPATLNQYVRGPSDVTSSGGSTTSVGVLIIFPAGTLGIQRDNVPTTFANSTAGCGTNEPYTATWYVGTGS